MRQGLRRFVDSYNTSLAFVTAVLTIFGALAVVISFGWKMFTEYVETQITQRTEFQRAVLTGMISSYNQNYDYAIQTLYREIQKEAFRRRSWEEATAAVDHMLVAIMDSGEQYRYAAEYELLRTIVQPHQNEHGFYRLQMGYGALFIERDPGIAINMFSKAIPIYLSQQMYTDAAIAYRGKVIAYGVSGDTEMAARNMISASICSPLGFPENEWERQVRNWPNEKWLAQFIADHLGLSERLKDAANLAGTNYAAMAAEVGSSCINTNNGFEKPQWVD